MPLCHVQVSPSLHAFDSGIGAVLMEEHDVKLFPVWYGSNKLSSAQCNYSTIEKECLAIVWGFKRFHLHLYGVPFVLQTDYEPLKYMNSAKFANGRLMRWVCFFRVTTSELRLSRDLTMQEQII